MARDQGFIKLPSSIEPEIAGELDARKLCSTHAALVLPETWENDDGESFIPKGFTTSVYADPDPTKNGMYFLKDLPFTVAANWERVGYQTSAQVSFDNRNVKMESTDAQAAIEEVFNTFGKTYIGTQEDFAGMSEIEQQEFDTLIFVLP